MKKYDKENETKEQLTINREKRLNDLFDLANLTQWERENYCNAISVSDNGYTIVHQRDIDETMVNSFNPEWTSAWDGSTDVQITLDFYAVITYITKYFTKDDTGTMKLLLDALKSAGCKGLREKMILLMNTWLTHRQMGESEAVYRIFRDFHLKESDVASVFIQACPREERSKFLMKISDKSHSYNMKKVFIDGKDGEYVEKYDLISKYERRKSYNTMNSSKQNHCLKNLCLAQFIKMYKTSSKLPKKFRKRSSSSSEETDKSDLDIENCNAQDFLVSNNVKSEKFLLPMVIEVNDPFEGEPAFLTKRKEQVCFEYTNKIKILSQSHIGFPRLFCTVRSRKKKKLQS